LSDLLIEMRVPYDSEQALIIAVRHNEIHTRKVKRGFC